MAPARLGRNSTPSPACSARRYYAHMGGYIDSGGGTASTCAVLRILLPSPGAAYTATTLASGQNYTDTYRRGGGGMRAPRAAASCSTRRPPD